MADLELKSRRFRSEREGDWARLEALIARIERGSARRLSPEELLEIPVLYRQALSSLSVARSISLDHGLIDYLESLCTRAYFIVYGVRTTLAERLRGFYAHEWPQAVRSLWRETLVAGLLFVAGALVAAALVAGDPDWYEAFVPAAMASGRDPTAATAALAETLRHDGGANGLSGFAAFLFTHNAQIALMAFALGFALCLPTAGLLVTNGASLGALWWLFASRGLGVEAGGWLLIHGVTELFAVILAGAAGLSIGWVVIFPGARTRLEAGARAGRRAGVAMAGVVVMLALAGLLEGFGRQLIQETWARYLVAGVTAGLWGAYFYLPRRGLGR